MDYKDEQSKIPFYMTFPMQNLYLMEMEYEKDMERIKSLYPKDVRIIMPMIEERCDELEYEGSRIYDENPDVQMMTEEIMRLYEKIKKHLQDVEKESDDKERMSEEGVLKPDTSEKRKMVSDRSFSLFPPEGWEFPREVLDLSMTQMGRPPYPPPPPGRPHVPPSRPHCNDWLCSMVGVLFQDEVYRRRCRHRRCHRWW